MTWLWILLGIIGYAFIAGIFYYITTETDLTYKMDEVDEIIIPLFWPLSIPFAVLLLIAILGKEVMFFIVRKIRKL